MSPCHDDARDSCGASVFAEPFSSALAPETDTYLGTRDLFAKFEGIRDGRGVEEGWGLALMVMLIDPVLYRWVPAWVVEQYERANPFFKEVMIVLQDNVNATSFSEAPKARDGSTASCAFEEEGGC